MRGSTDLRISDRSLRELDRFLSDLLTEITKSAGNIATRRGGKIITDSDVSVAELLVLERRLNE